MKSLQRSKYETIRSVFTSPEARRRTVVWLLAFTAVVAAGAVLVPRYVPWLTDVTAFRLGIEAYGPLAPVVFVAAQATQVVVAPVPGQVLGVVSGYLFGTVLGTFYSLLGAAIGSFVVFRLSRRYGRSHVERAIEPALVEQFDDMMQRRGLPALFAVFLVPGLPDDVVCFVAGLTDLRIRDLLAVSVLGRLPGYLVVNAAGAQAAAGEVSVAVVLLTLLVVLSVVGFVYREALLDRLTSTQTRP